MYKYVGTYEGLISKKTNVFDAIGYMLIILLSMLFIIKMKLFHIFWNKSYT